MKNKKGFNLVEAMVVISIISILSGIGFYGLNSYNIKKRTTQAISDLTKIKGALEIYYMKNGLYPVSSDVTKFDGFCLTASSWSVTKPFANKDNWIPSLVASYISKTPVEPNSVYSTSCASSGVVGTRQYMYRSNGFNYKLVYLNPESMGAPQGMIDPSVGRSAFGYWTEGAKGW